MRTRAIAALLLITAGGADAAQPVPKGPVISLRASYRTDTLDFSDDRTEFFREGASIKIKKKSGAAFTHIHVKKTKRDSFTWYISIQDISPYFTFLAGSYSVNFGAGLLLGKKKLSTGDLYSQKLMVSRGSAFVPCTSGNSAYAYTGAMAGTGYRWERAGFILRGFFSVRHRFTHDESYPISATHVSYASILSRRESGYRYSEPVSLRDYGAVFDLVLFKNFLLQLYFYSSDIRRPDNRGLVWKAEDVAGVPIGEKGLRGYGAFFQYRDDAITIFVEYAMPERIMARALKPENPRRGYGALAGFIITHKRVTIAFSGKYTGKKFFAPSSTAGAQGERGVSVRAQYRPARGLKIGASALSTRRTGYGYREKAVPVVTRESLFCTYRYKKRFHSSLKYYHLKSIRNDEKRTQDRADILLKGRICAFCTLEGSGSLVREKVKLSFRAGGEIALNWKKYITLSAGYNRFYLKRESELYTERHSFRDAVSSKEKVSKTSHRIYARLQAGYRWVHCTAGYSAGIIAKKIKKQELEFSAGIKF